ncbi:unnamed protein product [Caenorhabditis angaria]|uniref:Sodium/nucleoside cotransporter n=1 Tax=Caenorhabditis angaria TaxID=860376 RepID=A0A9P1IW14_9PELO|nr:unnamed protein product [Caenorhabditis angaria]
MKVEDAKTSSNIIGESMEFTNKSLENNMNFIQKIVKFCQPYFGLGAFLAFLIVYHGWLVAAAIHNFTKASPMIYITIFLWFCFVLNLAVNTSQFRKVYDDLEKRLDSLAQRKKFVPISIKICIIVALLAFTIIMSLNDFSRLSGFSAYVFFILFMFIFSNNRKLINWNIVTNAFIMHYCLAIIILQWSTGQWFFQQVAKLIVGFLEYAQEGAVFVFGFIASPPNICNLRSVFIFTSLQTLIYFGAVTAILFHFQIIQTVLIKAKWFMKILIGTTTIESVNAWACTFLGMTEAPMMFAPYISSLTDSELCTILTSGFACVAGTVFAAYVALGACPIYLLTASILSAPCSLACSKIMFPETEETKLKDEDIHIAHRSNKSLLDAVCSAGCAMVPIVFAIGATLLVIISLLALLDTVMGYIGDLIGFEGWTFQMLFGYAFFPLAYLMGVTDDVQQTLMVAQLMGTKTAVNEFVAYNKLGELQKNNILHPKSVLIATYALCGFSNFSSMGMQIEFIGGMAPNRRNAISNMMLRALIAGSIACFMNATIAGILVSSPIICHPTSNSTCFEIP